MKKASLIINLSLSAILVIIIFVAFVLLRPRETPQTRHTLAPAPKHSVPQTPAAENSLPSIADCIAQINFYGDTSGTISPGDRALTLEGAGGPDWGYAAITFSEPLNIWNDSLVFLAQGTRGGEKISFAFTDDMHRTTARDEHVHIPLTAQERKITIKARDVKAIGLDKSKLTGMHISVTPADAQPGTRGTVTVKDIAFVPNRRP